MENLKLTEILSQNKKMAAITLGKPYRVNVLSNVTINAFKDILEYFLRINKIEPSVEIGNYDNILQDSISIGNKDVVIVMYEMLNVADVVNTYFEDIDDNVYEQLLQKVLAEIKMIFENLKDVPTVIFNSFSSAFFVTDYLGTSRVDNFVNTVNDYVKKNKPVNVTFVNTNKIISQLGTSLAFDRRFYLSSKAPYSIAFFKIYCTALLPVFLKNTGKLKKAIIFDCDNTLWNGILGEDGFEGLDMSANSKRGKDFNLVQQMAKYLSKRGVIIGICSKNNAGDVDEVIKTHKDIILTDQHIVIKKVNWEDKATNLLAIAKELNIGTDSIVFVDDSSFEVNLIKEQLPEILTLQVPQAGYADYLQTNIYSYFNTLITKEDAVKADMYKQQFKREESKYNSSSIEDYLASLQMEIYIDINNTTQTARISQLSQKTNQFNLTTKRYTESQIEAFLSDENIDVISLSVKDKFGDNGLTGVCIVKKTDSAEGFAVIESLLMSCRVIGRNIETAFLNSIILWLKSAGTQQIEASFFATQKNAQVNLFYDKMGFAITKETESEKRYLLHLSGYVEQTKPYIAIHNEIILV